MHVLIVYAADKLQLRSRELCPRLPTGPGKPHNYDSFAICTRLTMFVTNYFFMHMLFKMATQCDAYLPHPQRNNPTKVSKAYYILLYTSQHCITDPPLYLCRLNEGLERSIRNESVLLPLSNEEQDDDGGGGSGSDRGRTYGLFKTIQKAVIQGGSRLGQVISPFSRRNRGSNSIVDNRYVTYNLILILQIARILTYITVYM